MKSAEHPLFVATKAGPVCTGYSISTESLSNTDQLLAVVQILDSQD